MREKILLVFGNGVNRCERGLLQLQGEAPGKERNTVVTNLYIIIKLL